ncbi:Adenine nucleotide transporter BT1, chloroplastic/mitochondrial [Vitis vinifera]|uniref:Adenine nucleotide transporter BT1, chloroplastic/mitochondrial n=1 Tax=Vitis vinifera TaxID=29760 RepID=A0A438KEV4_VITVI|nr:Adenine nucleotide transporter BT1, chloroplastic/mitochondrial [Vitis vinifera]
MAFHLPEKASCGCPLAPSYKKTHYYSLFAYDTVNKNLSPIPGEQPKIPIPASLVAGACAGVSSTLVTYPLELLKTRLTIQGDVYNGLFDAFVKILQEEKIGNIETLLIGSLAGAISSSATFPLEVARKHMQVGALSGRQVYKNVLHALSSILEQEGIPGLYKGLGPSCLKLVPAAGISFMCYEACKRILVENEEMHREEFALLLEPRERAGTR